MPKTGRRPIDVLGQRFGAWTVMANAPRKARATQVVCRCDCGTERTLAKRMLREGISKSCGCRKSEYVIAAQITHGMTGHPAHSSWHSMRQRCLNSNAVAYEHYGGRGITVCERWNDFSMFWEDMGPTWFPKATIERRDVNGNYEPSNCRWITQKAQPANTRANVRIDSPWGILHISEVARRCGISLHAFRWRLKRGWTAPDLFSPPRVLRRRSGNRIFFEVSGRTLTVPEAANALGMHSSSLYLKIKKGRMEEIAAELRALAV
jgi:hypothetical protein